MLIRLSFDTEVNKFYKPNNWGPAITDKPAFLDACYAAVNFLTEVKLTNVQLSTIEGRVQTAIGGSLDLAKSQLSDRIDSLKQPAKNGTSPVVVTPKNAYAKKVTATLQNILKVTGGFSDQVPKFVNFVQTAAFNQNLQDNKQWKDPGVSPVHGEYTHQLQWALLVCQFGAQIGTYQTAKLFQDVGKVQAEIEGQMQGLWQMLFDRGIEPFPSKDSVDFREPNRLLEYVFVHAGEFPLLAGFFQARKLKREMEVQVAKNGANDFYAQHKDLLVGKQLANEFGISPDILWSINYVTRKKYPGRSFGALAPNEKDAVLDGVNAAII